ncbi:MAG: WD40 repeat domain-containing protein [Acidimicrobiales bacterium]
MNGDVAAFDPLMVPAGDGRLDEAVSILAWSRDGSAVAAGSLGGEIVFARADAGVVGRLDAGAPAVSAAGSGPGAIAVGCDDGGLWLWSVDAAPVRHQIGPAVEDLAWSHRGLAVAARDSVVVFRDGHAVGHPLPVPFGGAIAVAWRDEASRPDLVAGGLGGVRELWLSGQRGEMWPLAAVLSLAVEPGSGDVAAGTLGGDIELMGPGPGGGSRHGVGRDGVECVSWSADGSQLCAVADGKLRVWRRRSPAEGLGAFHDLVGHHDWVVGAAFSPVGPLLASVGLDGCVALWDPAGTTDPLERLHLAGELSVVAWRPDGEALAVGGPSGGYWVLDASRASAVARSRCEPR